jgi:lipopolysaccharide heptosyltransferase II
MAEGWKYCKNILCIRPDNMGDLLMSGPAIRALKDSFHCRITVLTSSMAAPMTRFMPEIDDVICFDLPWVKKKGSTDAFSVIELVQQLKSYQFDAAVTFTVYSQNPLPAVMIAYMAEIPLRLAYCRENPYELLTHWVPDKEPYSKVQHQVKRDLELVSVVGAYTRDDRLKLNVPDILSTVRQKLIEEGVDISRPWLILHPGVSEEKREFAAEAWIETGQRIVSEFGYQLLLTGSASEQELTNRLARNIGGHAHSLAGKLNLHEFITLVKHAPLLLSVNTGPVHIAAAVNTPVIVLYALTNPQHLPWKAKGLPLVYDVPENLRSKNEVIQFVHEELFYPSNPTVTPDEIINAVETVLDNKNGLRYPEMLPLRKIAGVNGV